MNAILFVVCTNKDVLNAYSCLLHHYLSLQQSSWFQICWHQSCGVGGKIFDSDSQLPNFSSSSSST